MRNDINTLRDHLFSTLEALRTNDPAMTTEKAKTICDVSEQIINTAKVEVSFLNVTQGDKSDFFEEPKQLEHGVLRTTKHYIR